MPQATPSAQQRFLSLLKQDILKLDMAELDFGIYRILNYRRAQILEYLDLALPARIAVWTQALAQASGRLLADTEAANCYYHLHVFFSRYWDEGDFIPRARRGGSAAYAVPYNGQDTHFHWATKGSHYVKSGELFARYAYKDNGREVRFCLERADIEKDNAKGAQKYFFPAGVKAADAALEVSWQWRAATDLESKRYKNKSTLRPSGEDVDDISSTEDASAATEGANLQERVVNAWLAGLDFKAAKAPPELNPVLLASNVRRFVRKNTSDFFVHPQLGEFLRGELDVYLKHEFVQVWDARDDELPRIRAKFRLVRDIALDLIVFLDQIERFQATLFEKRKFVLQADYLAQCSWLLREGGEAGRQLVAQACASAAQAREWAQWLGDKTKKPDGKKLLAACPHLPLHTRHFDADFKARLLACFDDLEAALGGELIHADNYAALRTIEPAYRERVKCIYIDPPYNTGGDGFLYKDEFTRHSAWASLMDTRLHAARSVLAAQGVLFGSIDDNEHNHFRQVLDGQFGAGNFVADIIWQKKYAPQNDATWFSDDHDYLLCYAKDKLNWMPTKLPRADKQDKAFTNPDSDPRGVWMSGDYTSNKSADERPGLYYPVQNPMTGEEVLPGKGRVWAYSKEQHALNLQENRVWWGEKGQLKMPRYKRFLSEVGDLVPRTIWSYEECGHNQEAIQILRSMFEEGMNFTAPKPPRLIERCIRIGAGTLTLDFFAGSATTGHAVINLNREDGGARKFLLVEQGEYFDSVTLPRIAKVMASPDWKDGQPKDGVKHDGADDTQHWSRRTLPLVRVLRLERYEDSLNALDFEQNQPLVHAAPAQAAIDLVAHDAQEHLLRYWLMDDSDGQPVRLSTQQLTDPFAYQLTLHEPTGERLAQVDLQETARLLLGLVPKRQRELKDAHGQRHQLMEAVLAADLARGAPQPKLVLLWLRAVADERDEKAAQAEYTWLAGATQTAFQRELKDYADIFYNRAAFWPAGRSGTCIDSLLAERMMERAR
ncbi:adenine-specific DNA-methyltransferase [Polaromonas sp. CG_9.5]|uniref:site-specific DNA-methyltransferase n=1 Tax=Polaromonas sp. CG_9.5 TaxID=3071705 RepID=UPI002E09C358|nr:adenine-specific DNA-methyltransferase [Polaromonas sp. CG_9.5]